LKKGTDRMILVSRLPRCCIGIAALAIALLTSAASHAQLAPPTGSVTSTTDWAHWKTSCSLAYKITAGRFVDCATSSFTARPFHFLAQSVVPGSSYGGGGRYSMDLNTRGGTQNQLQATSVITIHKFWLAELKFSSQHAITAEWNTSGESLGINFYARNRSMPEMPFFGLGPTSTLVNFVQFRQRDTSAGVEVTAPFPEISWLSEGIKIEGLWPSVGGVNNANVPSITTEFNEQTAPGLATQPPFAHAQIYLLTHKRVFERVDFNYNIAYSYFKDADTGHYSFRRFEVNANHKIYPERKKHGGPIEQNYFLIGARYAVSAASAGNAVPFYLQETLGGSDIDSQPTLLAFRDYRFRGPDLLMLQAQYYRKICETCGLCRKGWVLTACEHLGFMADYQAGQVALRGSDFDLSRMRQSFGGGIAIYLGKDVVFYMGAAFGGGEGTHTYFNVANFLN
jgi:hypothetical protein